MITSPFKLLDAYTAADKSAFWGREEEIAALYSMVTKNRLMLVYGQSGTGKTSLVQCGLAGRFDKTDWYPIFVRRQNDLNQSLETAVNIVLGNPPTNTAPTAPEYLAEALTDIYETYLRPAYLIFDQLEELFVLGTQKEQERFIRAIQGVLNRPVPCRILFIIREEYLAQLYDFERVIPTLFDRRLRVEPMGAAKVTQVLEGSFKSCNISVSKPENAVYEQIIANVSGGKAGIQLPYLQVYLDMLYRENFKTAYPDKQNSAPDWLPLEMNAESIKRIGKIDNVLEKFLIEQEGRIQQALQQQYKNTEPDTVRRILDAFVSEEGTKRPVAYTWKGESLEMESRWAALFKPISAELLGACCKKLEEARLLRFSDQYLELAHDALAALIDQRRSAQDRRLQETYARLQNNYRDFADTGEYLSRRQLNTIEEFLPALTPRLDAKVLQFIRESDTKLKETEQAELIAERRKFRRAVVIAIAGVLLAAIAIAAAFMAYRARREMAQKAFEAQRETAVALKVEGKYPEALQKLTELEGFARDLPNNQQQEVQKMQADWSAIARYVATGDSIRAWINAKKNTEAEEIQVVGALPTALQAYEKARQISPDNHLNRLVQQVPKDMETLFNRYKLVGKAMAQNDQEALAILYYETALKLKPGDPEIETLLRKLKK